MDWLAQHEQSLARSLSGFSQFTHACQWVRQNVVVWGQLTVAGDALVFRPDLQHPKNQALVSNANANRLRRDMARNSVKYKRWALSSVARVRRRRYLLRHSALEVFFDDRTVAFFNFPPGVSRTVWRQFGASSQLQTLFNFDAFSPSRSLRRSGLTQDWVAGKISNFEYLMALNTFAGRTFADLTQYFVFPWVLSDYESASIDLRDERVYRDLTKPVGALNPARLEAFVERQAAFEGGDIPPFLYGTHYSNIGVVLYFLVRLEPFTSMTLQLQSGQFDAPDRCFFSLARAWKNALTSPSDVKELIPELFYLPEMFKNLNGIDLGQLQDSGKRINDVELPPWADGSPEKFVDIHRRALESEYVSRNLHHWIDLIFGYKQRGAAAREAHNVFYYMTYEGAVNVDDVDDEVSREAVEAQIANFGQTPTQLFTSPHPARECVDARGGEDWQALHPLQTLRAVSTSLEETPSSLSSSSRSLSSPSRTDGIVRVAYDADALLLATVYESRRIHVYRLAPPNPDAVPGAGGGGGGSGGGGGGGEGGRRAGTHVETLRLLNDDSRLVVRAHPVPKSATHAFSATSVTDVGPGGEMRLLFAGYCDNSMLLWSLASRQPHPLPVFGPTDTVSCVAHAGGGVVLVGSADATVGVWRMGDDSLEQARTLYGHEDLVTAVCGSTNFDVCVSAAQDGAVLVHTIRKGKLVRALDVPTQGVVRFLQVSSTGLIVVLGEASVHVFTLNGVLVCSRAASAMVTAIKCSPDGRAVYVAEGHKLVVCDLTNGLRNLSTHLFGSAVKCIDIYPPYVMCGCVDGRISLYHPKFL